MKNKYETKFQEELNKEKQRENEILKNLCSDVIQSPDLIDSNLSYEDMKEVSEYLYTIVKVLDHKIQEHTFRNKLNRWK